MLNLNIVLIAGGICQPPIIGSTPGGTTTATLTIAVNERRADKTTTTYIDLKAYGNLAKFVEQYLGKGRNILAEGKLRMETWQDKKTGENRRKFYLLADSIQACDPPPQRNNRDYTDPAAPGNESDTDIPW